MGPAGQFGKFGNKILGNNKAGPVFKNISGGVAGITVGVDVIQGSEVAD